MPTKINIDPFILKEKSSQMTTQQLADFFKCSVKLIGQHLRQFQFKPLRINKKRTEDQKQKLSISRKKWLKDNPDKHPWRNKDKFQSKPCGKVKEFLTNLGIQFISEYTPNIEDRYFSIDIAMPDKMIALEINGNQHYERTGELKSYYQERHDLLEKNGWQVYEIHYSACFNLSKWAEFINKISKSEIKTDFDYFTYKPKVSKGTNPKVECSCGKLKSFKAVLCQDCKRKQDQDKKLARPLVVKIIKPKKETHNICACGEVKQVSSSICIHCAYPDKKPSKEVLYELVWSKPSSHVAKQFNVSDTAIKKWCRFYQIPKPPRGYWEKIKMVRPIGLEPTC